MSQYFNRTTRTISLFFGGVMFLLTWLFAGMFVPDIAFGLALGAGVLAALLLSLILPFVLRTEEKRYDGIEETLPQPVLMKAKVNIRGQDRPRDGVLYLTEDKLYLFSRDRKPYASETIDRENLRNLKLEEGILLSFRVGKALYSVTCAQGEELLELMRRNGWNTQ